MAPKKKIEEKELRKVMAAAKQKKKEHAKNLKRSANKRGGDALAKMQHTRGEKLKLKQKLSTHVTEEEVEELKKRMGTSDQVMTSDDTTAAAAAAADTPSKKQTPKKGGKKESKSSAAASAAMAGVKPTPGAIQPPFNYDVHVKLNCVFVNVTIHKVPHQCINLSRTTPTCFVLDTLKFTKKYELILPMPTGLKIVADGGECLLESGVLNCRYPIQGAIPPATLEERQKVLSNIGKEKEKRFKITSEGELVVRARRANLTSDEKAEKATLRKESKNQDANKSDTDGESAKKKPRTEESKKTIAKKAALKQNEKNGGKYMADGADMVEMAEAAGKAQKETTMEKVRKAQLQMKDREKKMSHRTERKTEKGDRERTSFERVVAEQKRMLQSRQTMLAPKPKKEGAAGSGKAVKFAATK